MDSEIQFRVVNQAKFIAMLNGIIPSLRDKVVGDGLKAAAIAINTAAKVNLMNTKKGESRTGYKYYSSAFKAEVFEGKTVDAMKVRAGVRHKKVGYKLNWIESGTVKRTTKGRKRKGKPTPRVNRGTIQATHFYLNALRSEDDKLYSIVSEAIIKSLEKNLQKHK